MDVFWYAFDFFFLLEKYASDLLLKLILSWSKSVLKVGKLIFLNLLLLALVFCYLSSEVASVLSFFLKQLLQGVAWYVLRKFYPIFLQCFLFVFGDWVVTWQEPGMGDSHSAFLSEHESSSLGRHCCRSELLELFHMDQVFTSSRSQSSLMALPKIDVNSWVEQKECPKLPT